MKGLMQFLSFMLPICFIAIPEGYVAAIEPLGPAKVIKSEDGAEMVLVPAGEFWMGSSESEIERVKEECKKQAGKEEACNALHDPEGPRHRVYLDAFYIDKVPVTNA